MVERRDPCPAAPAGFFAPPPPARRAGDLDGLDAAVAGAVSAALRGQDREAVAAAMTARLCRPVGRAVLDAYASPRRDTHNISHARFLALVAVTGRVDLLDASCRRIGAAALAGEELIAARLGHLMAERATLDGEIDALRTLARPIGRGTRG